MSDGAFFNAFFGRILNRGTALELRGGIDFKAPLRAVEDESAGTINIELEGYDPEEEEVSASSLIQPPSVEAGASLNLPANMIGKTVETNHGSPIEFTIEADTYSAYVGIRIPVVQGAGGQIHFVAGVGVTLRCPATLTPYSAEQWSTVELWQRDLNDWVICGDLVPA